jgi:hypothetical protein
MSGLYGTPGKRVYRKVPRVRIPLSPQESRRSAKPRSGFFYAWLSQALRLRRATHKKIMELLRVAQ